MNTFMLCALQEGYAFTPGNNLREQKIEGGMPRQVIKYVGAVHSVNVTILLENQRARQYFWAFWRQNQTKTWMWKLVLDQGALEDCECRFTSESLPAESFHEGPIRKMTFTVLVVPIIRDANFDQEIIDMWENGLINVVNDIEKIPNVWLPDAVGV